MASIHIDWSSPQHIDPRVTVYWSTGGPESQPVMAKVQRHPTALSYPLISPDYHSLHRLDHPLIVQVLSCDRQVTERGTTSTIVFERCERDLFTEIEDRRRRQVWWDEDKLLSLLEGLLEALAYGEGKRISHGNIRPENLFISGECVKLGVFPQSVGDMGKEESPTLRKPPLTFLSPERKSHIFKGTPATINPYSCDMYALGVVFIYMANLWSPSFEMDLNVSDHARRCQYYLRLEEYLRAMTDPSPERRPSYEDLLKYMGLHRNVVETRDSYTPGGDFGREQTVLPNRASKGAIVATRRNLDVNLCMQCRGDLLGFFSRFSSLARLGCGHQCHLSCFREFLLERISMGYWEAFYCATCSAAIEATLISHYLGEGAMEALFAEKMKKCALCGETALLQELQCTHAACQQCRETVQKGRKRCKVCAKK